LIFLGEQNAAQLALIILIKNLTVFIVLKLN